MPINFPSDLVITNNNYPLIKAEYQSVEGFMRVDTVAERDAIASTKRIESCLVIVGASNTPYIFEGANTGDTEWQDAGNWKNLNPLPAPDEGIQLDDLGALTATPAGTGQLSYNETTGDFTMTPPDISGKAEQSALDTVDDKVDANSALIAGAIGDISNNADDISDNAADIVTIQGQQTTQDASIAANTAAIGVNATDINTNEVAITALQGEQTTQNANIAANAAAIGGKVGEVKAGDNISVAKLGDEYTVSADDAPVQTIGSGSANVTVTEPTTGNFEIAVSEGVDAETTFSYVTTDAIGSIPAGTTIQIGTPLEDIIRDMLVSYQNLVLSIGDSFPTLEHDVNFSKASYTLNRTNPGSGDTSTNSGTCTFVDEFGAGDENFNYTPDGTSSQSIAVNVNFTPVVSPTATAGEDGQPKNNNSGNFLQFQEDNTQGASRSTRKDYRVWFRRYFGASLLNVNSGNLDTIFPNLLSNMQDSALSPDSYGNYNAPPDSQADPNDSYLYFICPECHITAGDYIITDGSFDITTAWPVLGEIEHNGCKYRILVSDTPASYVPGQLITLEPKP